MEFLTCPICGKKDIKMLTTHVSMKHKISKSDFLELYPGTVMCTNDMVNKRKETLSKMWENPDYANMIREALTREAQSVEGRIRRSDNMKRLNTDEKYADAVKENHKRLGYQWFLNTRNKNGRVIEYHGLFLRLAWEVDFVKFCEKHGVEFLYERKVYKYEFDGGIHRYFPDFYLPHIDTIVEIKPQFQLRNPMNIAKRNSVISQGDKYLYITENELYIDDTWSIINESKLKSILKINT